MVLDIFCLSEDVESAAQEQHSIDNLAPKIYQWFRSNYKTTDLDQNYKSSSCEVSFSITVVKMACVIHKGINAVPDLSFRTHTTWTLLCVLWDMLSKQKLRKWWLKCFLRWDLVQWMYLQDPPRRNTAGIIQYRKPSLRLCLWRITVTQSQS